MSVPKLIVMLTYNDMTVKNADEVFENCKKSSAQYFGFKEEPLEKEKMKELFKYMKECGKTTVLEVVTYTEKECIEGAHLAKYCGCDILMGTMYSDYINEFCKKNNILYMPFIGKIEERPSILKGEISDMIEEANYYNDMGTYGIDLLGYRYIDDAFKLNYELVKNTKNNVCIAGSINSYKRLFEIKEINPWAFTIGSAFFENKFEGTMEEQINKVYKYIRR